MDKQRVVGAAQQATGSIKKTVGRATGNRRLEAAGRIDKAEGRLRSATGKVKDAAREAVGKR